MVPHNQPDQHCAAPDDYCPTLDCPGNDTQEIADLHKFLSFWFEPAPESRGKSGNSNNRHSEGTIQKAINPCCTCMRCKSKIDAIKPLNRRSNNEPAAVSVSASTQANTNVWRPGRVALICCARNLSDAETFAFRSGSTAKEKPPRPPITRLVAARYSWHSTQASRCSRRDCSSVTVPARVSSIICWKRS